MENKNDSRRFQNNSGDLREKYESFNESFYDEDDDIVYAAFDGQEARLIIEPVETEIFQSEAVISGQSKRKEKSKEKKADLNERLSAFVVSIPAFIEKTGDVTINCVTGFFKKIWPFVSFPFVFLFSKILSVFKSIFNFIVSLPKDFSDEVKSMNYEIKIIRKQAGKTKKNSFFKAMQKYFVISFSRHRVFWKSLFNTAFPIAAVIIVLFFFSTYGNKITALNVSYNGKNIGYVESEEVFESGKSLARELLPQSDENNSSDSLANIEPVYSVSRVSLNQLSNDRMICENIISASEQSLVRACGVYINGEFFCAVANEADASTVFESILLPYKNSSGKNDIVTFVEEINYEQGLYPENSVWDSLTLKKKLNTPKTEEKYYKAKKDDSANLIAKKYSISVKQLKAQNPGVDFSKLKEGKKILVQPQTNFVSVKVMKTRTKTETIKYETEKKQSSTMLKGTTKVAQKGSNGKKVITELVTYINNIETYSVVVSEKQTVDPVKEIIYVGTKSASSYYSYSSSDNDNSGYSASSSSGFIWPTRGAYGVSSNFGYRSASISGWSFHGGIDIVKPGGGSTGTPVIAAASGTVVVAQSGYSGYGHTVVIDHGNGLRTRYAHMQPGSIRVRVGQTVYQGQQIGNIGSTGNVTGPHLHFEVLKNGTKVNPRYYIG
ncbi:MAG: peptidoglycan DD-metalloendopeptidase family protein [Acutalibacteraceae bacterium]